MRMRRLDELQGLLRSRTHATGAALAVELGISIRTLNRDIALLRDAGVPVEAERGRGGGMRLQPQWSLGRMHFNTVEAIDVLVSLAIAEQMAAPLLLRHVTSIRRKIVAAFAERDQRAIQ